MGEANLWIWGGTALVPNPSNVRAILEDAAIGIEGGKIVYVGTRAQAKVAPGARKIDATGCLVSAGFVNCHSHSGMSLLRGLGDDLPLKEWLDTIIFPNEQKHGSPEFVYWGGLLAAAEMIRNGTTAFNDMYFYQFDGARAADEAGLRMIAGLALTESSDVEGTAGNFEATFERFREAVADFPLVTPAMAPHAIYSVQEASWKKLIAYAGKHGVRINFHFAESPGETDFSLRTYGKTPTRFFQDLGMWELDVNAAHAVCLSPEDIAVLGKYRVGVSHNPESNLKLGTQIAPVVEMMRAGVKVGLGTDGCVSNNDLDLLGEADFAAKLQSFKHGPGALKVEEVVGLLTYGGAEAVGLKGVGRLAVGQAADVIALEVTAPHAVPLYNPYSHLVYAANSRDVRHTIVNGKVLMENRNLMTLDEQEILREAASWARRIIA